MTARTGPCVVQISLLFQGNSKVEDLAPRDGILEVREEFGEGGSYLQE